MTKKVLSAEKFNMLCAAVIRVITQFRSEEKEHVGPHLGYLDPVVSVLLGSLHFQHSNSY